MILSSRLAVAWGAVLAACTLCACELVPDTAQLATTAPSEAVVVAVDANPRNALSLLATVRAPVGARVRLRAQPVGGGASLATRWYDIATGAALRIPVLGLAASARYDVAAELVTATGEVRRSSALEATTGALPPALAHLRLAVTGTPADGFLLINVIGAGPTGLVAAFDQTGALRWYRQFEDGPGALEAKRQPNGNVTVFLGDSRGFDPLVGGYVEVSPDGELVARYAAPPPLFTDGHDLLLTAGADGEPRAHLIGYDFRQLTGVPGATGTATVAGHYLLRMRTSGAVEFSWRAWDHLSVDDADPSLGPIDGADFDHPNSLVLDAHGNYVVSFRSLSAVLAIDAQTGERLWQLGGRRNQFTFVDDPWNGFSAQHSAKLLDERHLLLFDNGWHAVPRESRAVVYALDFEARTARRVWEYRYPGGLFSAYMSSVQRTPDGSTYVGFAMSGHIVRATAQGDTAWEAQLWVGPSTRGIFYRAVYLPTLDGAP